MNRKTIALSVALLMVASCFFIATNATAITGDILEGEIVESAEDVDGDGRYDYLVFTVPVNVTDHMWEWVNLEGTLWDMGNTTAIAFESEHIDIEDDGRYEIELRFSGRDINGSSIPGPYVLQLELLDSWMWPPVVLDTSTYYTAAYSDEDFEIADALNILAVDWWAVDDDNNTLYDRIQVNISMDVFDPGPITINCWASTSGPPFVNVMGCEEEFDVLNGTGQTYNISLDGRIINGSGFSETQYDLNIDITATAGFWESYWIMTDPLNASDFEEYDHIRIVGDITCTPIDTDGDGMADIWWVEFEAVASDTAEYSLRVDILNASTMDSIFMWSPDFEYDGYLIAGITQTVVIFVDAYTIWDTGDMGPYVVEVVDDPDENGEWAGCYYIMDIDLGNITVADQVFDELSHPTPYYISGFVVNETGAPIPGVDLMAQTLISKWDSWDWATSNGTGAYNFTSMTAGEIMIQTDCPGYVVDMSVIEVTGNVTNHNITLEELGSTNRTINGTVFNETGAPMRTNAQLLLIEIGVGIYSQSFTDAEGNYSFDVRDGEYMILGMYYGPDYELLGGDWVTVAGDNQTVNITLDQYLYYSSGMHMTLDIYMSDWNSVDFAFSIVLPDEVEFYKLYGDLVYGNSDGYLSAAELQFTEDLITWMFMHEMSVESGLYTLDMITVDGIAYFLPQDQISLSISGLGGDLFDFSGTSSLTMTGTGDSYGTVSESLDSHNIYLATEYEEEDFSQIFHISVPAGFALNDTNDPENVTVTGTNYLTVIPGGSPDPENIDSEIVILTVTTSATPTTGSIEGSATLQDESDHSGITVELLDDSMSEVDEYVTGSDGSYHFVDVEPGSYHIEASMSGYYTGYADVTVVAGELSTVDDIELIPLTAEVENASLMGKIVTEAGLPIDNATVELYYPADSDTLNNTFTTGEDGEFSFTDLIAGSYRLEISADGFDDKTISVTLNWGDERNMGNIVLTSPQPVGYITGVVMDEDGNPMEGVTVEVRTEGSDDVIASGTTDEDGIFLITGLEDGNYSLTFLLDGKVIGETNVTIDDMIGDAGTIVIPSDMLTEDELLPLWLIALIAVIIVAAIAAVALMKRKPKKPSASPILVEQPSTPPTEDIPPPPAD